MKKEGVTVYSEIMLPIISTEQEFNILKDDVHRVAREVMGKKGMQIEYMVGTMIELPRAALIADKIAKHAEFFSFGTNDLTQMTFGFSRDDVGSFVPDYIEKGILKRTHSRYWIRKALDNWWRSGFSGGEALVLS